MGASSGLDRMPPSVEGCTLALYPAQVAPGEGHAAHDSPMRPKKPAPHTTCSGEKFSACTFDVTTACPATLMVTGLAPTVEFAGTPHVMTVP